MGDETQHLYAVSPTNLQYSRVSAEPSLSQFDQSRDVRCAPGVFVGWRVALRPTGSLLFYQKSDDDDKAHETEALSIRIRLSPSTQGQNQPYARDAIVTKGSLWAFEAEFSLAPLFAELYVYDDCLWACPVCDTYLPMACPTSLYEPYIYLFRFLRPDTTHSNLDPIYKPDGHDHNRARGEEPREGIAGPRRGVIYIGNTG